MILIGSRALCLRAPQLLKRAPLDFDWICTRDEFNEWMETHSHKVNPTKVYELPEYHKMIVEGSTNCEFELIEPGTSTELLADLVYNDKESFETPFGFVPSLSLLFAIKDSHKYKKFTYNSANFWKHCMDWHLMRAAGASIKLEHKTFHKLREQESYAAQKHPKLNVSKDDFFKDDGIEYLVEHDDIHVSVAPNGIPAYTHYLKDNEPVLSDMKKFLACPREIQLAGVVQESACLAIERALLTNHKNKMTPKQAWIFALAKIMTSITSGKFRKFAFENAFEILKLYPENYWEKFQEDLKSGAVRYINKCEQKN